MAKDEKTYSIDEALELVKTSGKEKFDASVEAHINLGIDLEKQDQTVRTTTTLPNGTGKTKKVAVFSSKKIAEADIQLTEADLKKIEKGKLKPGVDFDVIISEPKYMPKIATVARVLGPQGMMPNPKSGTVTEDVEKAAKQIKKGRIEIRNEPNAPIIHVIIGRKSFEVKALKENFEEVMSAVNGVRPTKVRPENYIESIFVCSSMGPSFKVQV